MVVRWYGGTVVRQKFSQLRNITKNRFTTNEYRYIFSSVRWIKRQRIHHLRVHRRGREDRGGNKTEV